MTLTVEDRRMLAEAYRLMVRDAEAGDAFEFDNLLHDPFWVFYADVMLGGHDVVMQAIKRNIRAQQT